MKTTFRFALVAAALGMLPVASMAADADCLKLAVSVKNAVAAKPAEVLQIVEAKIQANPNCACEVVKAAIQGSEADSKMVAAIVETAAKSAPEKMHLVEQCAIAIAPDSLADVQAVMARLDPNKGEKSSYSAKHSAKGGDVAPASFNPLDFPGQGPVGPTPGGPPPLPPGNPPSVPPIVNPPSDTVIDRPIFQDAF